MVSFFELLYSVCLDANKEDRMVWKSSSSGKFNIKSFYVAQRGLKGVAFPWKSIRSAKVPRRVAFFVWTTILGKI